jgi:hypothetical protein
VAFAVAGAGSIVFAISVWIVLRPAAMPPLPKEPELNAAPLEETHPVEPAAAAGRETLV